jgi:hypothetical protein
MGSYIKMNKGKYKAGGFSDICAFCERKRTLEGAADGG